MGLFGFGKKKDEYDEIFDNGDDDGIDYSELDQYEFEEDDNTKSHSPLIRFDYETVYDEEGNIVPCNMCYNEMGWKDGVYVCPECGQEMSRSEFFNYIGAEPPGIECIYCNNLYPGCIICPFGYVDEDIF